jgi:hypothetical protein
MAKTTKLSARERGVTVEDYIAKLPDTQREIVSTLVSMVKAAAPAASLSIKWAQPVFEENGPFCYVRAFKSHVNLGFWRGVDIDAGRGQLETGGQKMAHVKITTLTDIPKKSIPQWVKAAVKLNKTEGDPTKKR